jgi:DNA modification methylase
LLAHNKLAELAGWDEDLLRAELRELEEANFDLEVIGFSDQELGDLLAEPDEVNPGLTDEDAAPEAPEHPVSQAGDLWLLGNHRVWCGDATHRDHVERLMAGELADLVFTDPPYNVDYTGYTEERLKIKGDRMKPAEFDRFLRKAFGSYRAAVKTGASVYICHASSVQREFQNAIEKAGFQVRCQIIWAKNTFAWGFGRYKFQHEPIFYCHVEGQSDAWYGDKSQSTLWQEKKPAANRLHPTMKPVELIERALHNSSKSDDCVLDLFGGSGSTLIACERRKRSARLMEVDPKYTDVIVKRWQEYTGRQATLADDDRSFDEVAAERLA